MVQEPLRQTPWKDICLALKRCDEKLLIRFFTNMSERTAALTREEMEFIGPVRLVDVEAAQATLADLAGRLLSQCRHGKAWQTQRQEGRHQEGMGENMSISHHDGSRHTLSFG